jgi:hypothetical protein
MLSFVAPRYFCLHRDTFFCCTTILSYLHELLSLKFF